MNGLTRERLSLWRPFPVGIDEDGQLVRMLLVERNLLLGGEPGAGKSATIALPLAVAALDPDVQLYLFDGKRVEFAVWKPIATRFVGSDLNLALRVLAELQAEMERRYDWLEAHPGVKRRIERGDGWPLIVVACDEVAYYLQIAVALDDKGKPIRDAGKEFATLLRDLVARGRAAGIIVLAATQKPSSDVVPTALRDLFGFRWALRCTTKDASDTILGTGWATQGYSAATIAGEARGVGYLLAEGRLPVRLRSFYLTDDELTVLASRAVDLRARSDRKAA